MRKSAAVAKTRKPVLVSFPNILCGKIPVMLNALRKCMFRTYSNPWMAQIGQSKTSFFCLTFFLACTEAKQPHE